MKKRNNKLIWFVIIITILLIVAFIYSKYVNSEDVVDFIQNSKSLAPISYIIFVALQVLLFPIPGQFAGIAGGYFFGYLLGTLYSIIGLTLGSYVAFYLSRKFGRVIVEKIDKKSKIRKLENLIKGKEETILFLILLLPFLPDDLISFIAGLTKMKTINFIFITIIGRLPGFLFLNLLGAGMSKSSSNFISLLIFILVISVILFFYRNLLERKLTNFIKNMTRENNWLHC